MTHQRKRWTIGLCGLLSLAASAVWAQVPPPPPASPTLWSFLGIPQAGYKIQAQLFNRRGNFPGLEKKPPLKAIADVANLKSDVPAIKAAAEIKAAEDLKPQKIKAIKYLATIGCGCYDKDEKVTKALLAAMDDCTEEVRLAAVRAVAEAAQGERCANCKQRSCCNEKLVTQLSKMAYDRDDSGCFVEPSERVRAAAIEAACTCCPGGPPPIESEAPTPAEGTTPPVPMEGTGPVAAPPPPTLESATLLPPRGPISERIAALRSAAETAVSHRRLSDADESASDGATSDGATSGGATSDGATMDGAGPPTHSRGSASGTTGTDSVRAAPAPAAARIPSVAPTNSLRTAQFTSGSPLPQPSARRTAAQQTPRELEPAELPTPPVATRAGATTLPRSSDNPREMVTGHVVQVSPDGNDVHLHLNEGGTLQNGTTIKIFRADGSGSRIAAMYEVSGSEPGWANARLTGSTAGPKIARGAEFVAWR